MRERMGHPRKKDPALGQILQGDAPFGAEAPPLGAFLKEEIRAGERGFTFRGREPLREIAAHLDGILRLGLPGRTVSVLKGAQVGLTTLAIGLALYAAAVRRLNVGYFLPDQDFADRFDATRVRPLLRGSKLARAMREGCWKGASPKGLLEFPRVDGSRFLYVLGLRDIGNAISLPLDLLIRDEVDDLPPGNLKWSEDRLDASRLALTVNLAVGRMPGEGIHAMYLRGDQRRWLVPCLGCGKEWALEEEWPGVLKEEEGRLLLACPGCGAALSPRGGRWAAAAPGESGGERSYRLSQLAVPAIGLERVAAKWEAARLPGERARFRCSSLAMPDAGEMQPLTRALFRRLRDDAPCWLEEVPA
ncbi:MAG: phage terminase large subunit family protein [Candidatus Tectomicrobia bacterium]|uniref:Phage terminase large subunit family protein n=1 Tax=Tectimicrobiota bacterium TaxID=2528274 RepID=A0A932MMI2_UNCTE|nr:phage terminase large subunit family protein [Candidatus Tectomicrobia bacterium]